MYGTLHVVYTRMYMLRILQGENKLPFQILWNFQGTTIDIFQEKVARQTSIDSAIENQAY